MKSVSIIMGLAGALLLAGAIGLAIWAGMPANPLVTLAFLVGDALGLTRLIYLVMVGLAVWLAIAGLRKPADRSALTVLTLLPPALGLLAALLSGLSVMVAMERTGSHALMVIAPSLAETATPLAIGLLLGAVAGLLKARAPAQAGQAAN